MRRTMRKRLTRPDRVDAVTRTMVVTRTIVNVEAAKCKSQQSSKYVMKEKRAGQQSLTLEKGLARFLDMLSGKNRSSATIRAYHTDLLQFIHFLHATNVLITSPQDIAKVDVLEYFSHLAKKALTGVARARKMSAIREYFRFLEGVGQIEKSPTVGVETPKREKNTRQFLRSDEYTKMLSLAGATPRDYAILQVFLQTGIRVSELAHLTRNDLDFVKPSLTVAGKGKVSREIALEKKGMQALKSYLGRRPYNGYKLFS
jgi:integrase/recombinase XerD